MSDTQQESQYPLQDESWQKLKAEMEGEITRIQTEQASVQVSIRLFDQGDGVTRCRKYPSMG